MEVRCHRNNFFDKMIKGILGVSQISVRKVEIYQIGINVA